MYTIFLVGPSGSGKTTYVEKHLSQFAHLSTDDLILKEAARQGKTYMDIFSDYYPTAEDLFKQQISYCKARNVDCVIDRTNLTEQSRKRTLQLFNQIETTKVAIYFPAYTAEFLQQRIEGRAHQVPLEVIKDQRDKYRLPQKNEGFDLVVSSSHFIDILSVMEFR